MANTKQNKFVKLLTRDNSKVQKQRAQNLAKVTESAMNTLIADLENKIIVVEDQLDSQLDVTTSNDLTSMNAITEWDAESFIKKRVENKMELINLNLNLDAAREVQSELFG